jgi:hypothetical protein
VQKRALVIRGSGSGQDQIGERFTEPATGKLKSRIARGPIHPPETDEQRDFRPPFGGRRSEADVTENADDVRSSFRLDGCDAAGDQLV